MAKKVLSVRVEEEKLEQINYFCEVLGMSQADLVAKAIDNFVNEAMVERSGGATITLPNPNLCLISEEQKEELVSNLEACAKMSRQINNSVDFGLYKILAFADERLLKDSDGVRKQYQENLVNDIEKMKGGVK